MSQDQLSVRIAMWVHRAGIVVIIGTGVDAGLDRQWLGVGLCVFLLVLLWAIDRLHRNVYARGYSDGFAAAFAAWLPHREE